jgi:hypothetical protein
VVNMLTTKQLAAVVHNAARGIAIAQGPFAHDLVIGTPPPPDAD